MRKPTRHARTGVCKTRQGSMHKLLRLRFTPAWLAIPCGRLQLRTARPSRRRRTGQHRSGREDPPSRGLGTGAGPCVFSHAAPALQGSLPVHQSLAGRPSSAGGGGAVRRSAISAPAGGLGGRCPRPPAAPAAARGAGRSKGGAASPRQIAMSAWTGPGRSAKASPMGTNPSRLHCMLYSPMPPRQPHEGLAGDPEAGRFSQR